MLQIQQQACQLIQQVPLAHYRQGGIRILKYEHIHLDAQHNEALAL